MTSLFHGVRPQVCRLLGLRSLNHRADLLRHRNKPLSEQQGAAVGELVYEVILRNVVALLAEIARGTSGARRRGSEENWRMQSPGTECDALNRPREVGLERAVVDCYGGVGNPYWWNQVPVASGLFGGATGKRRAIDLIHRRSAFAYDIVELKLGSNTPLFAAIEALEYGFAWLLSREHSEALGYGRPEIGRSLLAAEDIQVSVLAPAMFYRDADYAEFGAGLNTALEQIGGQHGIEFGFADFKTMSFDWNQSQSEEHLKRDLDALYPNPA